MSTRNNRTQHEAMASGSRRSLRGPPNENSPDTTSLLGRSGNVATHEALCGICSEAGKLPDIPIKCKPRVLLMGQRRSGKTSISQVVFHKLPPSETLFLESTTRIQKGPIDSFVDFEIWDLPGQLDLFDPTFDPVKIFSGVRVIIWVIDAQDDPFDSLIQFQTTIMRVKKSYPNIHIELFIHKVDGIPEDHHLEIKAEMVQRTEAELIDFGMSDMQIGYHLTSIYDNSIFEAFSQVIQRLVPQLGTIENMMNLLCATTAIRKAFLFDVFSKIYIATDSSPVDLKAFEICNDYFQFVHDICSIYGGPHHPSSDVDVGSNSATNTPETSSKVILQDGTILYLKEINRYLVLICLLNKGETGKGALIDYNAQVFQDSLLAILGGED